MFEDDQVELIGSHAPKSHNKRKRAKMKTETYTIQHPRDSSSTLQSSDLGSTSTTSTTVIRVAPNQHIGSATGQKEQELQMATDCVGDLIKTLQMLDQTMSNYLKMVKKKELQLKTERVEPTTEKIKKESDEITITRSDKVNVFVRIVYLKIGEIDTVKENFAADIFLQTKWREPALDSFTTRIDDIDWDQFWDPKIHVDNILGESKQNVWRSIHRDEAGEATVQEKRRIKAVFMERMELKQFPFDTQELSVHVVSERPETEVSLEEDESEVSSINVQSFVDEQEWKLHSHVEVRKEMCKPQFRNVKYHIPGINFCCRAFRRGGFFIYNIILVMFCIMGLAFATFSVSEDKPQNRLQLSFTLVLTTITFKFVVNQSLPKISYLTYLDKYILISMSILCMVCVWHAIVMIIHTHYGRDTAEFADMIAIIVLGGVFILFQVIYVGLVSGFSLRSRWHNMKLDQEFQEKFDRTLGIFSVEKSGLNDKRVGPA